MAQSAPQSEPPRPRQAQGRALRILLAEDHQIVRQGLRSLLSLSAHLDVVDETDSGYRAIQLAKDLCPDVIVMDIGLPGIGGIDATAEIVKAQPHIAVVMLSMHNEHSMVQRALHAGAMAYVLKGEGIEAVREAIATVARGERYISAGIAEFVAEDPTQAMNLTPREQQILKLVAEGYTGKEMAGLLDISPKTIEKHRAAIMTKLEIRSTAALVRYAVKAGVID